MRSKSTQIFLWKRVIEPLSLSTHSSSAFSIDIYDFVKRVCDGEELFLSNLSIFKVRSQYEVAKFSLWVVVTLIEIVQSFMLWGQCKLSQKILFWKKLLLYLLCLILFKECSSGVGTPNVGDMKGRHLILAKSWKYYNKTPSYQNFENAISCAVKSFLWNLF